MPTPTFDRLAPAKRDAFLDAALAEFAAHDFDTASVSRVVAELGIAKGSVYQYFADKADLHHHLVTLAEARLLAELDASPAPDADFFTVVLHLMTRTADAAARFPRETALLERAYRDGAASGHPRARHARLLPLVRTAQQRGELRRDVDPELLALVADAVVGQVGPWLDARLPRDAADRYASPAVEEAFGHAVALLRDGLAP